MCIQPYASMRRIFAPSIETTCLFFAGQMEWKRPIGPTLNQSDPLRWSATEVSSNHFMSIKDRVQAPDSRDCLRSDRRHKSSLQEVPAVSHR